MTNELYTYITDNYEQLRKKIVTPINQNTINHNGITIEDVFNDWWLEIITELADCSNEEEIDRIIKQRLKQIKLSHHKRPLQLFEQTQYFEDVEEIEEIEPTVDITNYLLTNYSDSNFKIKT